MTFMKYMRDDQENDKTTRLRKLVIFCLNFENALILEHMGLIWGSTVVGRCCQGRATRCFCGNDIFAYTEINWDGD